MKRMTEKLLIEEIDRILTQNEATYRVSNIVTTHYSKEQYESGACKQIINFKTHPEGQICYFRAYCDYSKTEIATELHAGSKLALIKNRCGTLDLTFKS